ncbi:MAG: preprotein translocase subunit SecG [Candidatus Poribacteria bacterium]|nr:preprotein translocase subunit SecG [Candidatus Poribacteria bacterium]
MEFLSAILVTVFVIVCAGLIIIILLQPGKGDGLGAISGVQSQYFGGGGAANFLTKLTTGLAIGYMVLVIVLGKFSQPSAADLLDEPEPAANEITLPAVGDSATPDATTGTETPASSTDAGTTTSGTSTDGSGQ